MAKRRGGPLGNQNGRRYAPAESVRIKGLRARLSIKAKQMVASHHHEEFKTIYSILLRAEGLDYNPNMGPKRNNK